MIASPKIESGLLTEKHCFRDHDKRHQIPQRDIQKQVVTQHFRLLEHLGAADDNEDSEIHNGGDD